MAIRGDLLSADLSNVFQMLTLNRKRGRVIVQDRGNFLTQRRLFISEERITLDDQPHPRPLVALLVEMGVVSYDDWHSAKERAVRYHADPLHLLRQQGLVNDKHLD